MRKPQIKVKSNGTPMGTEVTVVDSEGKEHVLSSITSIQFSIDMNSLGQFSIGMEANTLEYGFTPSEEHIISGSLEEIVVDGVKYKPVKE